VQSGFDVAIVGAGPAGTSTALHLLRLRPRTTIALLDRAKLPREKPCGGAISRAGLRVLEGLDATPRALSVDSVKIHAIRVRSNGRVNEHEEDEPLAEVVYRAPFDAALAREAARRGANLLEDHRVVGLEGRKLVTERGPIEARIVVGADGTGSAVRRLAGFPELGRRARLLVTETKGVDRDDVLRGDRGVLEFDLGARGFDGYVWHFATTLEGRDAVSRGVYHFRGNHTGDANALRDTMRDVLSERGLDEKTRGKSYTERVFVDANAELALASGVVLVGEAAGLVDPITGEGIAQALASGRVAAEEIARALDSNGVDPFRYRTAIAELPCVRHLRQSAQLSRLVHGRFSGVFNDALAACPSAVAAGCDWYAEVPLGMPRIVQVGTSMALALVRAGIRRARE